MNTSSVINGKAFFCILVMALWGPVAAWGQTLRPNDELRARQVAQAFFYHQHPSSPSTTASVNNIQQVETHAGATAPYLFSDGAGRFVLVHRASEPTVVGYGEAESSAALPQAMKALLAGGTGIPTARSVCPVKPLLKSERSQYAPFNNRSPYYIDSQGQASDTRCVAGCVATALEQVVSYWAYPDALQDTLWGWQTANYVVDTIPKGTPLDFVHILPRYVVGEYSHQEAQAVADLVYYCGVAARMNWGVASSGANVTNLVEPMRCAFGYAGVKHLYRGLYTPERWHHLIQNELEASRPVFFAGYTTLMQGHAFVIDGVDDRGFYHVDWGYGGKYNGYFDMDVFNTFQDVGAPTQVDRVTGHYCNQEALFLCPDSVNWDEGDTINIHNQIEAIRVQFSRHPDCNHYIETKAIVKNISSEPISTTLALISYRPSERDTLIDMECVALLGENVEAGATAELVGYSAFKRSGQRVVALVDDDMNRLWVDTLTVGPSSRKGVQIDLAELLAQAGDSATFRITIQNASATAWAGNLITYSLFEGPYTPDEGDTRQWTFLNLPPGESQTETITFCGLRPLTDYTFVVRNPWLPASQIAFHTGATGIGTPQNQTAPTRAFDLLGRPQSKHSQGWIIRDGKVSYRK